MTQDELLLKPGAGWAEQLFLAPKCNLDILLEAVSVFHSNFMRAHSSATFGSNIIIPTIIIERAEAEELGAIEKEGAALTDDERAKRLDTAIGKALSEYYSYLANNTGSKPDPHLYSEHIRRAYFYMEFIAKIRPQTRAAINDNFCSQLTGVWTAFEVLSDDLWKSVLDSLPNIISEREKRSILHPFGKVGGLKPIRKAYETTFTPLGEPIMTTLNDPSLDILASLRHIIVHNSAKFDQQYLDSVKQFGARAPTGAVGAPLLLDSKTVDGLLRPVGNLCKRLIWGVEEWLYVQGHFPFPRRGRAPR